MPHAYESMRDQFIKDGLSREDAERKAARIFNKNRTPGQEPVGPTEAIMPDSSGVIPRIDKKGPSYQGW
jgi:hypothetical protein